MCSQVFEETYKGNQVDCHLLVLSVHIPQLSGRVRVFHAFIAISCEKDQVVNDGGKTSVCLRLLPYGRKQRSNKGTFVLVLRSYDL